MSRKLNIFSGRQFLDANGDPYSGAQLFTYLAGTTTKTTLTQDQAGASNHASPIVLNTRGEPADAGGSAQPIWQADGVSVKLVLAPSTDSDPPTTPIATWDNLEGVNDTVVSGGGDQWITGATPTYVSATSFTLVGDVTTTYHPGRRIKTTNSGGTVYSTITASAYTTLTTVTVVNDDNGSLDSGLSAVEYSILTATDRAYLFGKGADVASASALTVLDDGRYFDVTGTTTITSINSLGVGTLIKLHFDGALTLTHHATDLVLPGGANITTAAGDEAEFIEYDQGDWRCTNYVAADGSHGASIPYSGLTLTGTLLGADITDYDTGNYLVEEQLTDAGFTIAGTYTKYLEFKVGRAGTINVRIGLVGDAGNTAGNLLGKIYKNGVAAGTERSMSTTSTTWNYWNEDIVVAAGDLIQLYAYDSTAGTDVATSYLALLTDTPVDEVGRLYTLAREQT